MDESIKCECGSKDYWFFGDYVRCQKCYMEYKRELVNSLGHNMIVVEYWKRRFNKETNSYNRNWEQFTV